MSHPLYRIGEFAQLCGVGKDTLFHYDKIGLLRPASVADNGYRYYTLQQYYQFHIISVLKQAGMPLREIKAYLADPDRHAFLTMLREKRALLAAEALRLKRMQDLLENTAALMEHASRAPIGVIQILDCEEEHFIATPLGVSPSWTEHSYLSAVREHLSYCSHHGFPDGPHCGEVVLYEDMEQGCFSEAYFITPVPLGVPDSHLLVKPRGTYAVLYREGTYESLYAAYRSFKEHTEALGYRVIGNLYEEDAVNYFSESDPARYVQKLSLHIDPGQSPPPSPEA